MIILEFSSDIFQDPLRSIEASYRATLEESRWYFLVMSFPKIQSLKSFRPHLPFVEFGSCRQVSSNVDR